MRFWSPPCAFGSGARAGAGGGLTTADFDRAMRMLLQGAAGYQAPQPTVVPLSLLVDSERVRCATTNCSVWVGWLWLWWWLFM